MAHICQVHPYEVAEGLCRSCGGPFCADCLVYPFGPVKPPYCVPCAVSAAGVRTTARNPTVVVPKETKRRLKEWRQARKRDLDSPPPDGIATWQKMDDAEAADDEDTAAAQAAAEREALRLPPPQPETPTPPPGINLAPPGPPGSDWRDEIAVSDADGFFPPGGDGSPEPPVAEPTIAGESALGAGWAGGDPLPPTEPVRVPDPSVPAPRPYPEPATTYAGPVIDRTPAEPAPFEPEPDTTPFTIEFDDDPLAAFGLGGGELRDPLPPPPPAPDGQAFAPDGREFQDPLPPPPPAALGQAFDPLPPLGADHGAFAPASPAEPLIPPPPAPLVAPHTMTTATPGTPRLTPPPPPTRHVPPGVARSAIRPPTPTRIPAAERDTTKDGDAKTMLARIAALRRENSD